MPDNEALVAYFSSQCVPEEEIQVPIADLESVISDICNSPLDVDSNPPLHETTSNILYFLFSIFYCTGEVSNCKQQHGES